MSPRVPSMPNTETGYSEREETLREVAQRLVQYRIIWPNGFGEPIPAKLLKRDNLQFITVSYRGGFVKYSKILVLENPELEHVTLPEAVYEYQHVIARKVSTDQARKAKLKVTLSASAFRFWCLLQAVLRIFGSQLEIANYHPKYLSLRAIVDEKTGVTYSSTMIWVRKTETIVLVPDYTTTPLEDIQYPDFITSVIDITKKVTGIELKLTCKQYFWVWQAIVSVEFCFREDYVRKNAIDTARTQTARQLWRDRAQAAGKEPDHSDFVENYKSRITPGKKTAVLLPACVHISKSDTEFGTYDEDFVPATFAVNRAADITESDMVQAWQAVIKLRVQMGLIREDDDTHKNQPFTSDARNLWIALKKTEKKRANDRRQANLLQPWYPVHTLFKKGEDGQWSRRAPIEILVKARCAIQEARAARVAAAQSLIAGPGTEATSNLSTTAIRAVRERPLASRTTVIEDSADSDCEKEPPIKRQRLRNTAASTTRPAELSQATETTQQGPSQETLNFADQCIELFHKSSRNGGEKPDIGIAFDIIKEATQ